MPKKGQNFFTQHSGTHERFLELYMLGWNDERIAQEIGQGCTGFHVTKHRNRLELPATNGRTTYRRHDWDEIILFFENHEGNLSSTAENFKLDLIFLRTELKKRGVSIPLQPKKSPAQPEASQKTTLPPLPFISSFSLEDLLFFERVWRGVTYVESTRRDFSAFTGKVYTKDEIFKIAAELKLEERPCEFNPLTLMWSEQQRRYLKNIWDSYTSLSHIRSDFRKACGILLKAEEFEIVVEELSLEKTPGARGR